MNHDAYDVWSVSSQITPPVGVQRKTKCPAAVPDFSAGTREDWRKDADDFPTEALGGPLEDWDGEVWVDVNNEVNYAIVRLWICMRIL